MPMPSFVLELGWYCSSVGFVALAGLDNAVAEDKVLGKARVERNDVGKLLPDGMMDIVDIKLLEAIDCGTTSCEAVSLWKTPMMVKADAGAVKEMTPVP